MGLLPVQEAAPEDAPGKAKALPRKGKQHPGPQWQAGQGQPGAPHLEGRRPQEGQAHPALGVEAAPPCLGLGQTPPQESAVERLATLGRRLAQPRQRDQGQAPVRWWDPHHLGSSP